MTIQENTPSMKIQHILLSAAGLALTASTTSADLLITEIVDAPLPGGMPKWVELTNTDASGSIDLTLYSFGNFNNGGTNLGGGAATVLAGGLGAGSSYNIAYEADNGPGASMFFSVYGIEPDFYMGGGYVNGDDVLALFLGAATGDGTNATTIDIYGDLGIDGSGTAWEYTDSYAYRCGNTANGGVFATTDWTIPGANTLEAGCSGDDICEEANVVAQTTPGCHAGCSGGGCGGGGLGTPYCFCDGTGTGSPCGNTGGSGEGCANGSGLGGVLDASGSASLTAGDLVLEGSQVIASQPGLFFQGDLQIGGGSGVVFGDGLRCAGTNVIRLQVVVSDASGNSSTSIDIGAAGGAAAGDSREYQLWYRDPASSPCGATFNLTNGYSISWDA